jgi:hypothetical protein
MKNNRNLLNILYSTEVPPYLSYTEPMGTNLVPRAPTEAEEQDQEESPWMDLTTFKKQEERTPTPTVTSPDGSYTISLDEASALDWDNPASKDIILDMQIKKESRFNPNTVGTSGERGIAQFMPSTWEWAADKGWIPRNADPFGIESSIQAQYKMMNWLMGLPEITEAETSEARLKRALAAYNPALGNFRKALRKAKRTGKSWLNYVADSTKKYVTEIVTDIVKNKDNYTPKYKRTNLYTN